MDKPMRGDLIFSGRQSQASKLEVGGKGWMLLQLSERGYRVPPFFIVPTQARELVGSAIQSALDILGGDFYSVRSSVNLEDGVTHSFAGLFDTHLNVPRLEVTGRIADVRRSLGSPRVEAYLKDKGLESKLQMAIVVQQMVVADYSGVAFSRAPVGRSSDILIEAVEGLGEALVSGHANAKSFRLDRFGEAIQTPLSQGLKPEQIQAIHRLCLKLEKDFKFPVDLEWCLKNDVLYVLQVRPITKDFHPLRYFVDTNLVESYPGSVSPLTASFVKAGYRISFLESALILGAKGLALEQLEKHYSGLIEEVEGHLYYDLANYYSVLSSLPGGEVNIKNWHRMIGGAIENLDVVFEPVQKGSLDDLRALWRLLRFIWAQPRVLSRFVEGFDQKMEVIRRGNQGASLEVRLKTLVQLFEQPHGFGLTIVNDLVVMIGLKLMAKFLKTKKIEESQLYEFLDNHPGIESTKPLEELTKLIKLIDSSVWDKWAQLSQNQPLLSSEQATEILRSQGHEKDAQQINSFLQAYGDRAFHELKLECPTFNQSASQFLLLVRFLISGEALTPSSRTQVNFPVKLNPIESLLWRFISKLTTRSIQWREATRLRRSRFYNLIRELFTDLTLELLRTYPALSKYEPQRFFNLRIEDLKRWSIQGVDQASLEERLSLQPSVRTQFPEFLVLSSTDTIGENNSVDPDHPLSGQVACEGSVVGKALVVFDPLEALSITDLENYILVTPHTDPAWVYILSRCRGLVSEKGSILSHTAIIGRELNVPTLVGVKHACTILKTGEKIRLNTKEGIIERA